MRPGFDLGFWTGDRHFINNHLMFKILLYKTNGQYTKARQRFEEMEAASVVEVPTLHPKRLFCSGLLLELHPRGCACSIAGAFWTAKPPHPKLHFKARNAVGCYRQRLRCCRCCNISCT